MNQLPYYQSVPNTTANPRSERLYCTVSEAVPVTPPKVAIIVVVPVEMALAKPVEVMVATLTLLELHVTDVVMSPFVPSEYVAVAVYCCCSPVVSV